MYGREKSDYAVVPVNQPNKEDPYSAEVGEERAWTKENVVPFRTYGSVRGVPCDRHPYRDT